MEHTHTALDKRGFERLNIHNMSKVRWKIFEYPWEKQLAWGLFTFLVTSDIFPELIYFLCNLLE